MKRVLRILAAGVLAIGGVVGVAGAASAEDPPVQACDDPGDGYFVDGVCQLVVEASAACDVGVPYLTYATVVEGSSATDLDITWVNPAGDDVVLTGQPLSGRLLWPGVELGPDGRPTDYPGWVRNADGTWTEGDSMSWVADTVQVSFRANPEATTTVRYPTATAACVPTQTVSRLLDRPVAAALSDTGFSVLPFAGAAGGLVLAGGLLLAVTRFRRSHEER